MIRVDDFLTDIGDVLQEDYVTNPVWTKAEIFGYVKQALKVFCQLTQLVDKRAHILVDSTTGEASVPEDFEQAYFVQFDQLAKDIVNTDELDFSQSGWLSGTTGTPVSCSIFGSSAESKVRFVPVPPSVYNGGATTSSHSGLILHDGASFWSVRVLNGVIDVISAGAVATTPVIAGPTTFWDLTVNTSGVLITSASVSTTADDIGLADANVSDMYWQLTCTDSGALVTTPEYLSYGLAVAALIDNVDYQDFDQEEGIIVDAYASNTSTTPTDIVTVDSPLGVSLFGRTGSESGTLWYKGAHRELNNYDNNIILSDGLVPVLKHGVLALAFGHDGDGKDPEKAELMKNIFYAECTSIRGIFESRWE